MSDVPVSDLSIHDFDTDIRVRLAKETDLSAWQQFVDQMPQAGCMHHAGWYAVLRDSCWVKPYFLIAEDALGWKDANRHPPKKRKRIH